MKDQRTTIFTMERRNDFFKEYKTFLWDLKRSTITTNKNSYKVFDYLNHCIRYWPHRCGATSLDDYLKRIDIDVAEPRDDKEMLLVLELLVNLLHWAPRQYLNEDQNTNFAFALKKNSVENETDRMIENAEYLLEQCCNMTIREEENEVFPKYYITKRNAHVDLAVVAAPELKDTLLGYLDIRNEDNLDYKKTALTTIYGYMEDHRKEYKTLTCSAVSEEFFTSMNSFGIRHNTKTQIRMQRPKKMMACDKLFMMAVYVLQTTEVNDYKNELKALREKQKH